LPFLHCIKASLNFAYGIGKRPFTYRKIFRKGAACNIGKKLQSLLIQQPVIRTERCYGAVGFAAEKARHNNTVESLDEYMNSFGLVND
jgi:hypothetical protein